MNLEIRDARATHGLFDLNENLIWSNFWDGKLPISTEPSVRMCVTHLLEAGVQLAVKDESWVIPGFEGWWIWFRLRCLVGRDGHGLSVVHDDRVVWYVRVLAEQLGLLS
jgi:hypothetical protein